MLDPIALAASAVAVLTPFLQKAGEKTLEKLGEGAAGKLFDLLKSKLSGSHAGEVLADLEQAPADPDAQAALRMALRKAIEQQPELAELLQELIAQTTAGQSTAVVGDNNRVAQVHGNNNVTNIG